MKTYECHSAFPLIYGNWSYILFGRNELGIIMALWQNQECFFLMIVDEATFYLFVFLSSLSKGSFKKKNNLEKDK